MKVFTIKDIQNIPLFDVVKEVQKTISEYYKGTVYISGLELTTIDGQKIAFGNINSEYYTKNKD